MTMTTATAMTTAIATTPITQHFGRNNIVIIKVMEISEALQCIEFHTKKV